MISALIFGSITVAILFFIFCHYNRLYLRPRRLKAPVDNRAEVRRHTNEMEQFLIDDGCMSDLFTLTTWDESTVIKLPPAQKPRGGLTFVSPIYTSKIHSMSMQEYTAHRNALLAQAQHLQEFMTQPSMLVPQQLSDTIEVFGAKTKHCRWCQRGTQRTKGGLCMTCWDAGIR